MNALRDFNPAYVGFVRLGHSTIRDQCPDYPRKRTLAPHHGMSHECQNRTHPADAKPFCQLLRFTASYASRLNSTANG
jgi:hypothetical protein